jgi:hypothetical protein
MRTSKRAGPVNQYGLDEAELAKIRARDKDCVYCHKKMLFPFVAKRQGDSATIEHFNIVPPWNKHETVAICCGACNSSRSDKKLRDWFKAPYCIQRNINEKTVAPCVRDYLKHN